MYLCIASPEFFTAALSDVNKNIMLTELLIRQHTVIESVYGIVL